MPTFYVRKCPSRGSWTQEDLNSAVDNISRGVMSTWEAAKNFKIPYRTLKRRIEKNNTEKKRMGPDSFLGEEAENKLVTHIKKLQHYAFAPTATDVREMAFLLSLLLLLLLLLLGDLSICLILKLSLVNFLGGRLPTIPPSFRWSSGWS